MKTVFGDWFVERKSMHHPVEGEIDVFNVGQIIRCGGETLYHTSSEVGFKSFEEAKTWISKKPGATDDIKR